MANEKKIDYVLLGLLSHEDLTGYDIKKRLETRLRFFWNASFGSIYPALAKLESEHMITRINNSENGRERILYSITEGGRNYLCKWLEKPVIKDELRYETLLKLFFGNEVGATITLEHIRSFEEKVQHELLILEECVRQLEQYQNEETHKYYLLTAKFGVQTYRAYLKWCEDAEAILEGGCK